MTAQDKTTRDASAGYSPVQARMGNSICRATNGRRFRSGSAMVYAMAVMVVMVVLASLAVDYGRVQLAKTELQQACDAAARYGATGLPYGVATVKSRVATAAADNKVDGNSLVIDQNTDIEFGTWNPNTGVFTVLTGSSQSSATAIRITARRAATRGTGVPTVFAALMGQKTVDIKASAIAGSGQGADVVLIQDITSSFSDELNDAKTGDQAMLDALYASGAGWSRIAIAVHTGWGKTLSGLASITSNYSNLSSIVTSIKECGSSGMPVCSGTDIASGFDEAITIYTTSGYSAPAGGKTVILVSDGQPTASGSGKHPTLTDSQLLTLAQQRADTLWAQNVHVYVVFFDRDNDSTAASNLKSLVRGNGDFVRVSDPKDLPTALADITKKLPIQLVH